MYIQYVFYGSFGADYYEVILLNFLAEYIFSAVCLRGKGNGQDELRFWLSNTLRN